MATSTRRAPLATISNATNSPHRLLSNSGSKRPRALANVPQQENEPPQKRQVIEKTGADIGSMTPHRHIPVNIPEGRVFEQGHGEAAPTAFQRKLVAARDRQSTSRISKVTEQSIKDDSIRQWQKHYRKIFPTFTLYFDGIPEDSRARFVRHITALGAKEERFFSKSITHIITTRQIPSDTGVQKSSDSSGSANLVTADEQPQTINPSLLEKNPGSRSQNGVNFRRDGANQYDILARGRQMGMKIWAAEKLQRILASIFEDPRSNTHQGKEAAHANRSHQEDLSQVLKNEKHGAASEREQVTLPREMVLFKGPFIYVHDIDEKFRPTMVRDYPKVTRRQDGEWPQFRSAGVGKCPFVEDPVIKKDLEQERAKQKALQAKQQNEPQQIPRTRSAVDVENIKRDVARRTSPRKALQEVRNSSTAAATVNPSMLTKHPAPIGREQSSTFPPMPDKQGSEFVRPALIHMSREPAASGIQRSNLTSAIQSQMISSTAATGIKAGTSREVHELKRKVLERTHTGSLSIGSISSSHRMTDLAGALKNARAPAPQRAAKSKAQEKLGGIQENEDPFANDVGEERQAHAHARRKKPVKRDPKPGYCENCRDKYDDFEEHILSRKHRKFAITQSNWTELDALLSKLQTT